MGVSCFIALIKFMCNRKSVAVNFAVVFLVALIPRSHSKQGQNSSFVFIQGIVSKYSSFVFIQNIVSIFVLQLLKNSSDINQFEIRGWFENSVQVQRDGTSGIYT